MVSWDSDAVLFSFCPDDLSFGESEIPQLSVTVSWESVCVSYVKQCALNGSG